MTDPLIQDPVAFFLTIMAVILISPLLSERARLPGIAGLILGGILIGPHGFGLLGIGPVIVLLSTVGLIYLMFSAGLEIDLQQFVRVADKSLVFGALTFLFPMAAGTAVGLLIDLGWAGAILFGAVYASHTLVAFPIVSRLGLARNEAVAVTIGATVFTDVAALLVLAVIAGAEGRTPSVAGVTQLLVQIIGYAGLVLFGLPRLGKFFFRRFTGRGIEFQFVLVVLFVSAFLAEVIGMHAIVGAFLAGLAVNWTLPRRSAVVHQVLFLGESFFIPIFLMYIGMVTDLFTIIVSWQTVLLGLGATGLVYATKYAAATVTQRIYKYSQDEKLTMWGLSQAQAAATLATILVGQEVGLFPDIVFDAAIMAVFFTSISSPWLVQRFGSRLKVSTQVEEGDSVFDRILIPIANPKTQDHLTTLAAILARTTEGTIMPLHVVRDSGNNRAKLQEQEQLLETAVSNQSDVAVEPLRRIDSSVAKGILHASAEHRATMIAMGWRGEAGIVRSLFRQNFFGDVLDEVVWNAEVPVVVARMNTPINSLERLILVVPANSLWLASISRISEIALSISDALNLPLLILADKEYMATFREDLAKNGDGDMVEVAGLSTNVAQDIQHEARENDLVLISSTGPRGRFQSSLGRLPEEIAKQSEVSLMVLHYPERALRLAISKTEAPDSDETE